MKISIDFIYLNEKDEDINSIFYNELTIDTIEVTEYNIVKINDFIYFEFNDHRTAANFKYELVELIRTRIYIEIILHINNNKQITSYEVSNNLN